MELPKRKRIRLEGFDYASSGGYFVTMCLAGRRPLLWEDGQGRGANPEAPPELSRIGKIVEQEIRRWNGLFKQVRIDPYQIMADHVHLVIFIEAGGEEPPPTLSRMVQQFKGTVTKRVGFSIWQKSFYDHVIRNDESYLGVWRYIDENPLQEREP